MKSAEEGDDLFAPGVPPSQFNSSLNGLCAGVRQEDPCGFIKRGNMAQAGGQFYLNLVIIVGPGDVDEFGRLVLNLFNDFWMIISS
jgi:hypothetical protein